MTKYKSKPERGVLVGGPQDGKEVQLPWPIPRDLNVAFVLNSRIAYWEPVNPMEPVESNCEILIYDIITKDGLPYRDLHHRVMYRLRGMKV